MRRRNQAFAAALCALLFAAAPADAQYSVLGSVGCTSGGCHTKENAWWGNDKHNNSINLLYEKEALSKKYAQLLGISFRSFRYRLEKLGLEDPQPGEE